MLGFSLRMVLAALRNSHIPFTIAISSFRQIINLLVSSGDYCEAPCADRVPKVSAKYWQVTPTWHKCYFTLLPHPPEMRSWHWHISHFISHPHPPEETWKCINCYLVHPLCRDNLIPSSLPEASITRYDVRWTETGIDPAKSKGNTSTSFCFWINML